MAAFQIYVVQLTEALALHFSLSQMFTAGRSACGAWFNPETPAYSLHSWPTAHTELALLRLHASVCTSQNLIGLRCVCSYWFLAIAVMWKLQVNKDKVTCRVFARLIKTKKWRQKKNKKQPTDVIQRPVRQTETTHSSVWPARINTGVYVQSRRSGTQQDDDVCQQRKVREK